MFKLKDDRHRNTLASALNSWDKHPGVMQRADQPLDSVDLLQRSLGNGYLQETGQAGVSPCALHIQRACACGGSCASCGQQDDDQPKLQTKLVVGAPDDVYEQQADRVAEQVMRMPEPKAMNEEEEEFLQFKELPGHVPEVPPGLEDCIHDHLGSGQSLHPITRSFFEPRFGKNFSSVRIHTDATADQLSRTLNARAFTTRQHIFFRQGEYDPASPSGQELLAHELTHVAQQKSDYAKDNIQRGIKRVELTPEESLEWDIAILRIRISELQELGYEEQLRRFDIMLNDLHKIDDSPVLRSFDPMVQKDIQSQIIRIETLLNDFAISQRNNVKTVEESNVSWAAVGGIAFLDGPEPGPADAIALLAALAMFLFGSAAVRSTVLNPDLARQQSEALLRLVRAIEESISKANPIPYVGPLPERKPKLAPQPKSNVKTIPKELPETSPDITFRQKSRQKLGPDIYVKPKEPDQKNCFEKNPYALPCGEEIPMDEHVVDFIMRQGYGFESLMNCTKKYTHGEREIGECNGAPGETWHCQVAPYFDPIAKIAKPGGEVSIFSCLCCRNDGETGYEWRGAHWSPGEH